MNPSIVDLIIFIVIGLAVVAGVFELIKIRRLVQQALDQSSQAESDAKQAEHIAEELMNVTGDITNSNYRWR